MTRAAAATSSPDFAELWTSVSKLCHGNVNVKRAEEKTAARPMPGTATPPVHKGEAADASAP